MSTLESRAVPENIISGSPGGWSLGCSYSHEDSVWFATNGWEPFAVVIETKANPGGLYWRKAVRRART